MVHTLPSVVDHRAPQGTWIISQAMGKLVEDRQTSPSPGIRPRSPLRAVVAFAVLSHQIPAQVRNHGDLHGQWSFTRVVSKIEGKPSSLSRIRNKFPSVPSPKSKDFSMNFTTSVAHVEEERKQLAKDVHQLALLGVGLTDSSDGGVIVQNRSECSLVTEVKEKQDSDPTLLQLKETIEKGETLRCSWAVIRTTVRHLHRGPQSPISGGPRSHSHAVDHLTSHGKARGG
ncbi:hypothetical protein MTR67_001768 [Solanum verrucosum]|uniref:Uncharacterized protein n=1 Tax=Solanum verrucosum TaxID=315347 RepID=A0AAF0PNS4_SOLVR|nr:hypothetical protein MTR67_001768 [Solanum verrucosum]